MKNPVRECGKLPNEAPASSAVYLKLVTSEFFVEFSQSYCADFRSDPQPTRLSGRSGMTLNFDTIRLRNGRTYRFAGVLGSVRTPNGDTVKVDNEGTAQGENQTTQTVQRTAIGTAVGAIIGALPVAGRERRSAQSLVQLGEPAQFMFKGKITSSFPTVRK